MEIIINEIKCLVPARAEKVWHDLAYGALNVLVAGYGAYTPAQVK